MADVAYTRLSVSADTPTTSGRDLDVFSISGHGVTVTAIAGGIENRAMSPQALRRFTELKISADPGLVARATREAILKLEGELIPEQEQRIEAILRDRREAESKLKQFRPDIQDSQDDADTFVLLARTGSEVEQVLHDAVTAARRREALEQQKLQQLHIDLDKRRSKPYMTTRDVHAFIIKPATDQHHCRYVELDWAGGDELDDEEDIQLQASAGPLSLSSARCLTQLSHSSAQMRHSIYSNISTGTALVGPANYFVSHSWDSGWEDLVAAVEVHAAKQDAGIINYYWVDILAVCQHWKTDEANAGQPGNMPSPCTVDCVGCQKVKRPAISYESFKCVPVFHCLADS